MSFSPWAILTTWLHVGGPQENTRKMNSIPVLNKASPWAHMELESDMLDVPRKFVKYVIHLSKKN
jgi:hypothetical protein